MNTHTHREHTPGAVGSYLCCGAWGAVGGSVPCSRASRRGIEGGERALYIHSPTYNRCQPELCINITSHNVMLLGPLLLAPVVCFCLSAHPGSASLYVFLCRIQNSTHWWPSFSCRGHSFYLTRSSLYSRYPSEKPCLKQKICLMFLLIY